MPGHNQEKVAAIWSELAANSVAGIWTGCLHAIKIDAVQDDMDLLARGALVLNHVIRSVP